MILFQMIYIHTFTNCITLDIYIPQRNKILYYTYKTVFRYIDNIYIFIYYILYIHNIIILYYNIFI